MSLLSDNALSLRLLGCLLVFLLPLPVLSRRFARVTTPLHGPPSSSWLFGAMNVPAKSQEAGSSYEHWAEEYGPVFAVPSGLGKTHLVLCDPKAIQHFYTRETRGYIHTSLLKAFAERLVSTKSVLAHNSSSPYNRSDTASFGRNPRLTGGNAAC